MPTTQYDRPFAHFLDAGAKLLLACILLGVGILAGWAASTDDLLLVFAIGALAAGMVTLFFPRSWLMLTIVGGLVVAGLARLYVPQLQAVRWLVALAALILGIYALLQVLWPASANQRRSAGPAAPAVLWWGAAFAIVLLLSTVLNWNGVSTAVSGLKGYVQMWGVLLALALIRWPESFISRLPAFLLAIAWLQIPFAFQQFFFIVPQRMGIEGIVPVDIVVGTFGGQKFGGGANAALAVYMILVIAGVISAWKEGVISGKKALLYGLPLLAPLAVNEAKITLVYVVVLFAVLFGRDAIERPMRFLGGLLGLVAVLMLLASAYIAFAPKELSGFDELVTFIYEGNVEKDYTSTGNLTRWGAVEFWGAHHGLSNLDQTLLGHGGGATRSGEEEQGPASTRIIDTDLDIGRLGATAVLWETGVFGLICIAGFFFAAYAGAGRMVVHSRGDAKKRAIFRAIQAGVAVFFVSFWHKNFLVYHIGYQTAWFVVIGYLAYWQRWHGVHKTVPDVWGARPGFRDESRVKPSS